MVLDVVIAALAGAFCYVLDAALQHYEAVALSEAPLTLVQPLEVTSILFAVPLAAAPGNHRMHPGEFISALAVLTGLAARPRSTPTASSVLTRS